MCHEPVDGEGELWNRAQLLLRVRFHLDYPPRSEAGWGDPPHGYVEPLEPAGREKLAEAFKQYQHTDALSLRDGTHIMACMLTSPQGDLKGMRGWAKVP